MAGVSDYTENALLNWMFKGTAFAVPANYYIRLYSTNPTNWETMGGSPVEMVATGYTQYGAAYANGSNGANWTISSQGGNGGYRLTNNNAVTWTAGAADWESITGVGIFDGNLVGSNLIAGGNFGSVVGNGDTVRVAAGAIDIDFDVSASAGVTSYVNQEMAQKLSGDNTLTPPATLYVALFTALPAIKAGTGGTEVSLAGTAYARTSIAQAGWNTSTVGAIDNAAQIDYTTATASWGNVVGAGLVDTASGGWTNAYAFDGFTSVTMDSGDDFYIAAGAFDITLD
jgi:hypothetical protein